MGTWPLCEAGFETLQLAHGSEVLYVIPLILNYLLVEVCNGE